MEALTILAFGFVCVSCFMIGAKVGQTVARGETVETPNPGKAVREHKSRKEADKAQSRFDTILQNIESYDGTSIGQKEVPRG